jgi:cytochrome c553
MRYAVSLLFISLFANGAAVAATPAELLAGYRQAAGAEASAQRGAAFYARNFGVSARLPACATCHTEQPQQEGRHAVTGKTIRPLSPQANAERFTDSAKVEKWFRRNCTEVVGRECTAAEKADFMAFVIGGR